MRVRGLQHLQLDVSDVGASIRWYESVLGFRSVLHDPPERAFLEAGGDLLTVERARGPVDPSGLHFGFRAESEEELIDWREHLTSVGTPIVEERREEVGWSIYVLDPDGYRIEIFHLTHRNHGSLEPGRKV